jgi:hypothetical protein
MDNSLSWMRLQVDLLVSRQAFKIALGVRLGGTSPGRGKSVRSHGARMFRSKLLA